MEAGSLLVGSYLGVCFIMIVFLNSGFYRIASDTAEKRFVAEITACCLKYSLNLFELFPVVFKLVMSTDPD